jgi:hypothetical protein
MILFMTDEKKGKCIHKLQEVTDRLVVCMMMQNHIVISSDFSRRWHTGKAGKRALLQNGGRI